MALTTDDLRSIPQPIAAWLLGVSPRALRDKPDVPRNGDGTYNAAALLAWARGRAMADLPADDLERVLVLADQLEALGDGQHGPACDLLDDLRARHGDAVAVALVDSLLAGWRHLTRLNADAEADPAVRRQREAYERQQRADDEARTALRIVVVCDQCGKIRRGTKWTSAKVPPEHITKPGRCPACK